MRGLFPFVLLLTTTKQNDKNKKLHLHSWLCLPLISIEAAAAYKLSAITAH
jgi:hypothetical protein